MLYLKLYGRAKNLNLILQINNNWNYISNYGISGGKTSAKMFIDSVFAFAVGAEANSIFKSAIWNKSKKVLLI